MEGIMMRSPEKTAIAVRLPDGSIHMKTQPSPKTSKWGKMPLIRGVVNFVASLVEGTKVLMYSADILEEHYPEEYEKDKFPILDEEVFQKLTTDYICYDISHFTISLRLSVLHCGPLCC